MARWLRVLAGLSENLSSGLSSYMVTYYVQSVTPVPGDTSLSSVQNVHGAETYMQVNIHIK